MIIVSSIIISLPIISYDWLFQYCYASLHLVSERPDYGARHASRFDTVWRLEGPGSALESSLQHCMRLFYASSPSSHAIPAAQPCTRKVRPLAVLRSFSSFSGRARRRTADGIRAWPETRLSGLTLKKVCGPPSHAGVDVGLGNNFVSAWLQCPR